MSVRDLGNAIADKFTADSLKSSIVSISGDAVTLAVNEGANWEGGDILYLSGNNLPRVATVLSVSGDVLTLDAAPANSTPGVGAEVRGGFAEWVRPASSSEALLYVEPLIGDDPLEVFQSHDGTSNCQARLRLVTGRRSSQYRRELVFELTADGFNIEWCEGLLARAGKILHGQWTSLSVPAHDAWDLRVGTGEPLAPRSSEKSAGLARYILPISATVARALV